MYLLNGQNLHGNFDTLRIFYNNNTFVFMLKQAKKLFSKPDNMPKGIMSAYITLCCCTEHCTCTQHWPSKRKKKCEWPACKNLCNRRRVQHLEEVSPSFFFPLLHDML